MKYIITGIDTKQDGQTLLYLWGETPTTALVSLPHIIPSRPLPTTGQHTITDIITQLKQKHHKGELTNVHAKTTHQLKLPHTGSQYPHAPLEHATREHTLPLGRWHVIQLEGPHTMHHELFDCKELPIGTKKKPDKRNNISRITKLQIGWPFSYATGTPLTFAHEQPTIDELCALPRDAFDSEFEGWELELNFEDLDVEEAALRAYVEESSHRLKTKAAKELHELQSTTYDDSCQELAQTIIQEKQTEYEHYEALGQHIQQIPRNELIKRVALCKHEEDALEPFAICYVTDGPNFYFTKYPLTLKQLHVKTSNRSALFHNIIVERVEDMPRALEDIIAAYPEKETELRTYYENDQHRVQTPAQAITFLFAITKRAYNAFISGGHNVGSYDYPNIRGEKNGSLLVCGINGAVPRRGPKLGFYERAIEPGRHIIDTCTLSQKFFPGTIDNKLVTFMEHAYGITEGKALTYEDTTKKRIENAFGNTQSGEENAIYCMKDTLYHALAMDSVKRSIYHLCTLLKQSPEVLCSTSAKRIAENYTEIRSLARRGTYLPPRFGDVGMHTYDAFDIEQEKNRILFTLDTPKTLFDEGMDEHLRRQLTHRPTNEQADVFYLTPFIHALSPLIDQNPLVEDIFKDMAQYGEDRLSVLNTMVLAQGLQRDHLSMLVHALLNCDESRGLRKRNDSIHSRDSFIIKDICNMDPRELYDGIVGARERMHELFTDHHVELINTHRLTALRIPKHHQHAFRKALQQERLGYFYGRHDIISTTQKGRFLLHKNGEVLTQGIDAKFTRGLKNAYEREFMHEFLDAIFAQDYHRAVMAIAEATHALRDGIIPSEQLLYVSQNKRNADEYKLRALNNRMIFQKVKHDAPKGREFAWGYTTHGPLRAPAVLSHDYDAAMYQKIMFGEEAKQGWNFRTYTYGKEKPGWITESTARTSVGQLVESALILNTEDKLLQKQRRHALAQIVQGTYTEADVHTLTNPYSS